MRWPATWKFFSSVPARINHKTHTEQRWYDPLQIQPAAFVRGGSYGILRHANCISWPTSRHTFPPALFLKMRFSCTDGKFTPTCRSIQCEIAEFWVESERHHRIEMEISAHTPYDRCSIQHCGAPHSIQRFEYCFSGNWCGHLDHVFLTTSYPYMSST